MLHKDRKVLFLALTVIYVTMLIPIATFTSHLVSSPTYTVVEPDLFRDLNDDADDNVENDEEGLTPLDEEIVAVTERPTRFRKVINETERLLEKMAERQAIREFRDRKEKAWRASFFSPQCSMHRRQPPGLSSEGRRGTGRRAVCVPNSSHGMEQLNNSQPQSSGNVDVSLTYRTIYIPQPRGASTAIQDAFRKRLRGKRITDIDLAAYLKRAKLQLSDFFVFTFVRDPFQMFDSAYREVSQFVAKNMTLYGAPFAFINDTRENEPRRAITALLDAQNGRISPPDLYTQLWKIQRCIGADKKLLDFNFIGNLDTMDEDWRFVEMKLNLTHRGLSQPSFNVKRSLKQSRLTFDRVTDFGSPWSTLTKLICEYYRPDFECFGFNRTLCQS